MAVGIGACELIAGAPIIIIFYWFEYEQMNWCPLKTRGGGRWCSGARSGKALLFKMNLTVKPLLNGNVNLPVTQTLNGNVNFPVTQTLNGNLNLPVIQTLNGNVNLPVAQTLNGNVNLQSPKR